MISPQHCVSPRSDLRGSSVLPAGGTHAAPGPRGRLCACAWRRPPRAPSGTGAGELPPDTRARARRCPTFPPWPRWSATGDAVLFRLSSRAPEGRRAAQPHSAGPGGSGGRLGAGVCSGRLRKQMGAFPGSLPSLVSPMGSLWAGPGGNQGPSSSFPSHPAPRCPRCPRQPRWPSPARGSSSWQSPERQPPCWQSGTPCRNPSDTCPTTAGSFTWPVSGSCGLPRRTRAGWAPAGGLDVGPTPADIRLRSPFVSPRVRTRPQALGDKSPCAGWGDGSRLEEPRSRRSVLLECVPQQDGGC